MKKIFLLMISLLAAATVTAQEKHVFEDSDMKAVMNTSDGSLVSLVNKRTGWNIIPEGSGRSFEMILNNRKGSVVKVSGNSQKAPVCTAEGDSLVFIWSGLVPDGASRPVDIVFTGVVKYDSSLGLMFSGHVENNSAYTVETLVWPFLGRLTVPDRNGSMKFSTVTYSRMIVSDMFPAQDFFRANCNLPEQAFALIGNDSEGLYASSYDPDITEYIQWQSAAVLTDEFRATLGLADSKSNAKSRDNGIEYDARANRRLYLKGGESRSLVPFSLKTYQGTWHKGADIYKDWKYSWYQEPAWPEWVTEVNSWQQLQINTSESRINFKIKDLVQYAKECAEYGVAAIQLTGWNWGGQDRGVPYHTIDPRLGTMEEFKDAIAECAKLGVRIMPFTKFTWADFNSPVYGEYKNYGVKKYDGTDAVHGGYSYNTDTQLAGLNNKKFSVLCFADDDCREKIRGEFKKVLDLGAFGMVYDENQHHAGQTMCYSENHTHGYPGFQYGGAEKLGKEFYEMTRKYNPDFLMVGEACWDLQSRYYATYTRQAPAHVPAMRYLNPYLPISCAIMDHGDFNRVNMCLRCRYIISYEPRNFKGHLGEYPKVMEYGKLVDDFRRKYADYVWNAEFRDTVGAAAEGDGILHSVFVRKDGKRAVVVVNTNIDKASSAVVKLDSPAKGRLVVATPHAQEAVPFNGTIEIGPMGAAVIMEE